MTAWNIPISTLCYVVQVLEPYTKMVVKVLREIKLHDFSYTIKYFEKVVLRMKLKIKSNANYMHNYSNVEVEYLKKSNYFNY
jgi:hypothetical protein